MGDSGTTADASPPAASRPAARVLDQVCGVCGDRLRLWRRYGGGPYGGRCPTCSAAAGRQRRRERRVAALSKSLAQLLRSRYRADRAIERAETLIRSAGGPERLQELLGPESAAQLAVWLAQRAAEEHSRVDAAEAEERRAAVALDDPALRQEMLTMAIAEAARHPERMIAALRPQLLAAGWTPPPETPVQ